jgi:single-strand DNA-binding protein
LINKVILTGRLVADPEIVNTQSTTSVVKVRIAVDRKGREKETDFFDCVAFGKTGDFVATYLNKGRMVAIVGNLRVRSYDAQDGSKRKVWEIIIDEAHPLDSRKIEQGEQSTAPQKQAVVDEIEDPFAE